MQVQDALGSAPAIRACYPARPAEAPAREALGCSGGVSWCPGQVARVLRSFPIKCVGGTMRGQSEESCNGISKVKRLILAEREMANTTYLKNMFPTQLRCFVLLCSMLGAASLDGRAAFPL